LAFITWKIYYSTYVRGREVRYLTLDASSIEVGAFLAQLGEGHLDQPIAVSNKNLSTTEHKCTTIECEGLEMVYAL
jgi:hypothetical protein